MFKKNKKIGALVIGLSIIGIVSVGLNSSFTYQAGHADFPAPQKPDLAYEHGKTWSPANNKGDGGIVSNEADGNTGGSPSYEHGDTPAPQA